jgi:hypothetical protein
MELQAQARLSPSPSTDDALSRSVAAESALQAEVTLLRARNAQLTQALDEQRTTLIQGVERLLFPLTELVEGAGRGHVPLADLPVHVATWVRELSEQVREARAASQEGSQSAPAQVSLRFAREVRSQLRFLQDQFDAMATRVDLLSNQPAEGPDLDALEYGTFLPTDPQAVLLEKLLTSEAQAHTRLMR